MTATNEPRGQRRTEGRGRMERADSRALDGMLTPEEQARVERERAADALLPATQARTDAVNAYREAMALWVEDARRDAAAVDPQRLAERVLAAPLPRGTATAPWGYAAAAAALLAIGVGGLWTVHPATRTPDASGLAQDLERDRVAVLRKIELDGIGVEPK